MSGHFICSTAATSFVSCVCRTLIFTSTKVIGRMIDISWGEFLSSLLIVSITIVMKEAGGFDMTSTPSFSQPI
jgi:hypothetical protein